MLTPDFTYSKPQSDTWLLYVHRKLTNSDIYWINNRKDRVENLEATFRIDGKVPEIWHAETGKTEPASYSIANGMTKVNLNLQPDDAVFVVFKDKAIKSSVTLPTVIEKPLASLSGGWDLSFQKDRGAPESIRLNELDSWTNNDDAGIKYFSGTGTYTKTINASAEWFTKNNQIWMDLGDVRNLAEVFVNGKSLGILWKKPFRVDITEATKAWCK